MSALDRPHKRALREQLRAKLAWMANGDPEQARLRKMADDLDRELAEPVPAVELTCQMTEACTGEVTHIDEKGFVYCAPHGATRKSHCLCRQLRASELRALRECRTIPYRRR